MTSEVSVTTLQELVSLAKEGLEKEDRAFRAGLANNLRCAGQHGGILRIINERYYQFVVARSFAERLPFIVQVEDCHRDLTLSLPQSIDTQRPRYAVIEMKCWMSASGNRELKGISIDIEENLMNDIKDKDISDEFRALRGFMLIFSSNPPNQYKKQLNWLAEKLHTDESDWYALKFDTENDKGEPIEFWVAGYEVLKERTHATR